jgi:hypothetical protein
MTRTLAYCDRAGVIGFAVGRPAPEGTLSFFSARSEKACRRKVEATARRAYDRTTLLVPGVPEAVDEAHALEALQLHRAWLQGDQSDDLPARREAWQQRLFAAMAS